MPPIAVLIALADPTRARIIEILRDGPQPVHLLAGSFKISRPAISRHLRVLKQARLISEKKTGRENRYALHAEKLKPLAEWVTLMRAGTLVRKGAGIAASIPESCPDDAAQAQRIEPIAAAGRLPDKQPVADAVLSAVAPKPRRPAAIAQMGFDF